MWLCFHFVFIGKESWKPASLSQEFEQHLISELPGLPSEKNSSESPLLLWESVLENRLELGWQELASLFFPTQLQGGKNWPFQTWVVDRESSCCPAPVWFPFPWGLCLGLWI